MHSYLCPNKLKCELELIFRPNFDPKNIRFLHEKNSRFVSCKFVSCISCRLFDFTHEWRPCFMLSAVIPTTETFHNSYHPTYHPTVPPHRTTPQNHSHISSHSYIFNLFKFFSVLQLTPPYHPTRIFLPFFCWFSFQSWPHRISPHVYFQLFQSNRTETHPTRIFSSFFDNPRFQTEGSEPS